jgi:peptidyl-prolyl cis-trans isomerase C
MCSFMIALILMMMMITMPLIAQGFVVGVQPLVAVPSSSESKLAMGFFDGLAKAFSNEEYGAPPDAVKASARHILVKSKEDVNVVLEQLKSGEPWNVLASQYSTCPSKSQGGSLGSFAPGTMVPEFDKVVFSPDTKIGEIIGPVETKFGYHLIVVDKRTGGGDWY